MKFNGARVHVGDMLQGPGSAWGSLGWPKGRESSFWLALDASEVPWCPWHFTFITIIFFSHFLTLLLRSGSVFTFGISVFIIIPGKGVRVQKRAGS